MTPEQTTFALYVCRECGVELPYSGVGRPRVVCDEHRPSGYPALRHPVKVAHKLNDGLSRASRHRDPATSRAAAERVDGARVATKILNAFEQFGWLSAFECADVIEDELESTVRTAVSRLAKTTPPTLVSTGTTRPNSRGNQSVVWKLA